MLVIVMITGGLVIGDWFCIVRLIDCGLIVLVFGLLL